MSREIWTVGHSTRSLAEFLDLLAASNLTLVADVRRFPASRRHPHFNGPALRAALANAGFAYRHFPALGGRRSARTPGSPNTAWRVEAFNAFADHLATPEGRAGLDELEAVARAQRAAILCAEAVPWRCHRRVIADALAARRWAVWDILGPSDVRRHVLTEFARVQDGDTVTYPGLFAGHEPAGEPKDRSTHE